MLSPDQRRLLNEWLPGAVVEKDHSWGLVGRTVLELTHGGARLIVKAGGENDHHIAREVHAHLNWLEPWTSSGRAALLTHFETDAKLLVARYLPGHLVLESEQANDPEIYHQAGRLLAMLHGQLPVMDDTYEARANGKSLTWLSTPHRIAPGVEEQLRSEIVSWPNPAAALVPTHGDWQPRNWLVHQGLVSVIDFGRAALRPAMSDFSRLAAQEFRRNPALEAAFLSGYGTDPRESKAWHRTRVREAIGTAVWAYQVGDQAFEAQGHRMIADVLSDDHRISGP
jgi:thiamine kinase-like enzyme